MKKVYSQIWRTLDAYAIAYEAITCKNGNIGLVIKKEGKYLSFCEVDAEASKEEIALAVLAEHFRVLHRLDSLPKYNENGLNKIQAVFYWVGNGDNFSKYLALAELLEHCLANDNIWHGYSAFNFGGELSGYNDDIVCGAIEQGQRFMTFGERWDRAATWARSHGYDTIAHAMDAVDDLDDKTPRSVRVKAHDALVSAFWEEFKAQASRKEKRDAMEYAFNK